MSALETKHSGMGRRSRNKRSLQLGYESDSEGNNYDSDEGDDRELITEDDDKEKEDDNDDMFASEDEEESKDNIPVKAKGFDMDQFEKEQGLGKYDLEGKQRNNESNTDIEELGKFHNDTEPLEDSEEPKNEVQLEAFDLREEAETGTFDKDMNYTKRENSDDENEEDVWLTGIKSSEIKKAREAQLKLNKKKDQPLHSFTSTDELLEGLIKLLEPAETPIEALARLRPKKSKRNQKSEADAERKAIVFAITERCEALSNDKGIYTVYDMSREELMRSYYTQTGKEYQTRGIKRGIEEIENDDMSVKQGAENDDPSENEYGEKIWEYRWLDNKNEILGLFSAYEMKYWKDTYFENAVEVRLSGEKEFKPISDVNFED